MSKIGKKIISIPEKVEIKLESNSISVKGPKGELKRQIPKNLEIKFTDKNVSISPKSNADSENKDVRAVWGLTRALVQNMIKGVTGGFDKVLEFQGIGYKANVKENGLELSLGYSHPITIPARRDIEFKVEKNTIRISGIDKELVGQVAADIRSQRKPEPYKGSGIKYQGEVIKRKAGKKAVASG